MYQNIYRIEYSKVKSDYHMNLYEIHYICKYNPPFNTDYKSNNKNMFDFPELTWNTYIFKSFIDNIQTHYLMKYGEDTINVKEKLYSNSEFYNEIINIFINSRFTYLQFNPDEYSIKECLSDDDFDKIDELDYCKNDCLIENDKECDSCKDRITWREYYNNRIKESKLKFHNKE